MSAPVELYPHQQHAVEWLANRDRAFFCDDMGLGKTAATIRALDTAGARRILLIVPTAVLWNWRAEFATFSPGRRVQLLSTGAQQVDPAADVVATTHNLLRSAGVFVQLSAVPFDSVVVDEAHFFRNPTALRTVRLYGDMRKLGPGEYAAGLMSLPSLRRRYLLTGTPMVNDATDLWVHLAAVWPEVLTKPPRKLPMSFRAFRDRYTYGRKTAYGWRVLGNRNTDELAAALRPCVLRRRKEQVLKDLPPIRYERVVLRPEKMPHELEVLERDPAIARLRKAIADADGVDDPSAAFALLGGSVSLSAYRRVVGMAKVDPVAEMLANELDSLSPVQRRWGGFSSAGGDKTVVFGHHLDVLHTLAQKLEPFSPVLITGEVSAARRQDAVDKFQHDETCRVAVCNIVAAGSGITLTAASEMLFIEASWVPGENAQAANRCHRIGQSRPVRVRFVGLADTIDEPLVEILTNKTRMIRAVLDEPKKG